MSIRRILLNFIIMILTFTLQTTVFRVFAFGGVVPNLMLVFVTSIAFRRGDKVGLLTGFVSGFLVDIFFGAILGFYALLFMYIGFFVGKLHEVFYSQNMAIPIAIISVADFIYGFACYVLQYLLRNEFDIGYYMMNIIIPEMVYTAMVGIFYYPVVLKIHERIFDKEQRSEKKFV